MENNLFKDFEPLSSKQWKNQIQYELKGADYNETVVWESPEGIKVRPFYHIDEFENKISVNTKASEFKICQKIFVYDLDKSIKKAKDALNRGAESIYYTIDNKNTDVEKLITEVSASAINIYFNLSFFCTDFIKKINNIAAKQTTKIYVLLDPIGKLAGEGNWFANLEKDFENLNNIAISCSNIHFLNINSSLYQNAGATIVQQIAYTLAHVNEYFNRIPTIQKPVVIEVAVGTNYFFEIAKLRALRSLFTLLAKEYDHTLGCHIIAVPTKRNKTLYDYNVNMLRTTTECMSAILGGANAIANLPYDAVYHKDNEFGDRISRNQLLVLKHESYLDKVNNPADGSYYIEDLTEQLAEKSLELFKDIEQNGGFLHQLKEGTIQRKIAESATKEQELFNDGKEILLGTNKYPNKNDRMSHDLELFPFVKTNPRKTLIIPIVEKRLAEKIEQERLETEKENLDN